MSSERKFDFILFGASAYTGQFVAEELAKISTEKENQELKWAIAGRSLQKLKNVLKIASASTGRDLSGIEVVIADVDDLSSLRDMARQTRVVMTIVGPYTLWGENVVKACIAEKTSCLDLSGEANFLERMQVTHHEAAAKAGCYIVGACGLDSIPSDCGVTYLQKHFEGDLNSVELFAEMKFRGMPPKMHTGTYFSAIEYFAREHELDEYHNLLFPQPIPQSKYPLRNRGLLHYSETAKSWCVPFPGADISIVKRSQYKLYQKKLISRPVQMQAYVKLPLILCIFALIGAYIFKFICQFKLGRHILRSYPRLFTLGTFSEEGASKEQLKNLRCQFTLAGQGWSQKTEDHTSPPDSKLNVVFDCVDPGYSATAVMLVQAALTILRESDKIPFSGGVFPPGAAFAQTTLIDRLNSRGTTFKVDKPKNQ